MSNKKQQGGPGRGQGRKPLDKASPSVRVNASMTEAHRDKFQALGGSAWLMEQIEIAEFGHQPEISIESAVASATQSHTATELAVGYLRYEALRKLSPRQYAELRQRNLAGENFDDMVTAMLRGNS